MASYTSQEAIRDKQFIRRLTEDKKEIFCYWFNIQRTDLDWFLNSQYTRFDKFIKDKRLLESVKK